MHDASAPALSTLARWCVAALATCLLASCGLGDKAALEERITTVPARTEGHVVAGTITVESRLVDIPSGGVAGFGGFAMPGGEAPELPDGGVLRSSDAVLFTMDLATDRASLRRGADADPVVLIDDLVYFGRRAGVPEDDARPWVRLALDELAESTGEVDPLDENRATARVVSAIHPSVLTDLVAGTLTGSIEPAGAEPVAGETTTRYDVNVALDKAFQDKRRDRYPEDRWETVEALFEALAVDGDVHAASVWLDEQHRLRRFRVHLTQRPLTKVEFELVVTLEIDTYGVPYTAELPEPREVLTVDSVLRFVDTVTEREQTEAAVPPGLGEVVGDITDAVDEPVTEEGT